MEERSDGSREVELRSTCGQAAFTAAMGGSERADQSRREFDSPLDKNRDLG